MVAKPSTARTPRGASARNNSPRLAHLPPTSCTSFAPTSLKSSTRGLEAFLIYFVSTSNKGFGQAPQMRHGSNATANGCARWSRDYLTVSNGSTFWRAMAEIKGVYCRNSRNRSGLSQKRRKLFSCPKETMGRPSLLRCRLPNEPDPCWAIEADCRVLMQFGRRGGDTTQLQNRGAVATGSFTLLST